MIYQMPAKVLIYPMYQIWASSNPRGAERLPPSFVEAESDLYPRRLWGKPSEVGLSIPKLHNHCLIHVCHSF